MKECKICKQPLVSNLSYNPETPNFYCHSCHAHYFKGRWWTKEEWEAEYVNWDPWQRDENGKLIYQESTMPDDTNFCEWYNENKDSDELNELYLEHKHEHEQMGETFPTFKQWIRTYYQEQHA